MDDSLVFFDNTFTVIGNSHLNLPFESIDPEQIADFKCGRFVFLKDGTIIDLYKDRAYNNMLSDIRQNIWPEELDVSKIETVEITESFLNDLNKSVGIIDIRYEKESMNSEFWEYNIYTSDGKVYNLDVNYATDYRQIEQTILNMDGTLNCPQFPEAEEWTDIVDYCITEKFILALTSDGKLLSSGIEFEHENIVKFDIWDICFWNSDPGDLPVALTADGNLIFGELTSRDQISSKQILEIVDKQIEIAKSFTDVKDFTYIFPAQNLKIIIQKSDGSVWATQNDSSFTENVNIPDEGNISYDDDEEIAAELYCGTCDTLIPQGMSECPICTTEKESADINNENKQVAVNLLDGLAAMDDSLVFFNDSFTAIGRIDPKLYQSIDPTQVADLKCGRFVFLKDGTIIDLKKDDAYNSMLSDIRQNIWPEELDVSKYENVEITESFLNDLNKSVGIIDIRYERESMSSDYDWGYNIYTSDGKVYNLNTRYATDYRQIEQPILNTDGTLNCPQFPEAEEWTDIVDYCVASKFILALTSDGKLLSSGIEFEHENIVKFDIWDFGTGGSNYGDLPVALTADGNLIFGELINRDVSEYLLKNWDKQIEIAKSFTDVKDFTYTFPAQNLKIIVQKSDGSVWATQNDSSFTENVNIPQN
ncbi:MAG: hypothetical protein IJB44_01045, partial [Clostridia bacterium]|nr:hypothetical protein [Clostridia bacterium]